MEEKKIKTRIKEKFQKNKQIIGKQIIDFSDWVKHICAQPLHILEQSVKEAMIQTSSA